ncbi:transposase, mutator-like family protein [Leptospira fainei serovar Hurstbridge str. BUT 6]|uniref:Mutator family transposase n=1 Tax=Leptospira fainei serovar Hurstbridge str. BUT 6 TaxID=1193011 RepID=S3UTQ9_9LEPT|nr:transposase, mutator-like family protein [Leptospira fainei serovar Hurstbridge str. BUT 6]
MRPQLKKDLNELVRGSVEETLNALLDEEADKLCQASKYERSPDRVDTRAGSYNRNFETKAGKVKLKVPKLRTIPFESAIIERYKRRESSVEEVLMEMYLGYLFGGLKTLRKHSREPRFLLLRLANSTRKSLFKLTNGGFVSLPMNILMFNWMDYISRNLGEAKFAT